MAKQAKMRYTITNKDGEVWGESRFFSIALYLWHNMKNRNALIVTDTAKRQVLNNESLERLYQYDTDSTIPIETGLVKKLSR